MSAILERLPQQVDATMGFTKRPEEPPSSRDYTDPGYEGITLTTVPFQVSDARAIQNELSLDEQGFMLVKHKTAYAHERDPEVLRKDYLDEMCGFIQAHFKASWVVPRRQGMYVRTAARQDDTPAAVRGPAGYAHIDFARSGAEQLSRTENQLQGLPDRPYSRLMLIQAWRALSTPPQDFPLALCDSRTMSESDTFEKDGAVGPKAVAGNTFKSLAVHYNPRQRWYYFSNMQPDELILFKSYDSLEGRTPKVPHSAFDNRAVFPNARPRESVEARFFVYFE